MRVPRFSVPMTLAVFVMSGCASGPDPVPESLQSQVDTNVTFSHLLDHSDAHVGKVVVLGGQVLQAKRLPDSTRIEILQLPLDDWDRPSSQRRSSEGRFLAFQKSFLDPATLSDQPRVTIVGEVTGVVSARLDDVEYRYPTIEIKHLHLWEGQSPEQNQGFGIGLGIGGGGGGFGGGIGIGSGF